MPARLPIPGEDAETWGDILNEFLEVSHNLDGTLKNINLDLISNVDASSPSGGNVLAYDDASSTWLASAPVVTENLNDLNDVSITTPGSGHVLIRDATDFKNRALVEADISDLSHYDSSSFDTDLAANSAISPDPDTIIRRDAWGRARVADPQDAQDATSKSYVDGAIADSVAVKLIDDVILASTTASVTFSGIPQDYAHLKIESQVRSDRNSTVDIIRARFNGDTGNNYDTQEVVANGTNAVANPAAGASSLVFGYCAGNTAPAGKANAGQLVIPNYAQTIWHKQTIHHSGRFSGTGTSVYWTASGSSLWRSTAAITSIILFPSPGPNFLAGTRFTLYGLKGSA